MSFHKVLNKYREKSFSEKDKGERFERLMQAFLQTDPTYANQFEYVWMWEDFPFSDQFGGQDVGIDLVCQTREGEFWAVQCKCYREDAIMDKKSVDSFLATSSKTFEVSDDRKIGFVQRLWISTTNNWGKNAEQAIRNQSPPVQRLNLSNLEESVVDWDKIDEGIYGQDARTAPKTLRPHQQEALDLTHEHLKENDRGKLIMACGTGKTFTSLKIAENETGKSGMVLFLVPSIALLGQTLREWTADATKEIYPICICSDPRITKKKNFDFDSTGIVDLALPASTDIKHILKQLRLYRGSEKEGMTVVFSTYQSIDVISQAQKEYLKEEPEKGVFDLIICDEAHRTTGVSVSEEDESAFTKVHNDKNVKSRKRIYMTATPRLFSDDSKSKAAQQDAILCSMDDPEIYGEEIYRIGFGEAVERELLTDYKVLILTMSDDEVSPFVQNIMASHGEISTDDVSKLIGCINAMSKQVLGDEGIIKASDPDPMRRAVAFCQNIKVSQQITSNFNEAGEIYLNELESEKRKEMVAISSQHIDGSMSAPERDQLMSWLKSDNTEQNEARVLTNVRCLSEGVDVPSLDAVLFLSARNSQVDVVQSVGRVMRKAPGKKYGYIIIPVVVPSDVEASKALDDNERYKVVWSVLNALRAHDDRFNATVNKINLNKKKPSQILVGRPDFGIAEEPREGYGDISSQLALRFGELQETVFAKMVLKVGDRVYWEKWAKDVAQIAERQIERIKRLIREDKKHEKAFADFLKGLHSNLNPSVTEEQAIEMLSQHIITKPVFDALFEGYSFVENNPVSQAMQHMLDILEESAVEKDTESLDKFYESVRKKAEGIDNAEGKQKIIIELYDKFFKTAFPKMVEQLGIVYTPTEVVDFIIHSVNDVLKQEFGRTLSDKDIHILDPFTGTGTFITRLLQSGLIDRKDVERKFKHELHANELVLLAYYIAAINIENAYHDILGEDAPYESFEGMVLTDTFQLGEIEDSVLFSEMFPKNSERLEQQKKGPIRVIIGNPPYSISQGSANDNAQNQSYEKLDRRILETYSALSKASLNRALYDPYIKAFRWSTDRLDQENGGIICFVSNGGWLDGSSTGGFRKSIEEEFDSIYVFNLRGNQRTSGELSRKEGGKIFGSGSRTPVTITLLINHPNKKNDKAEIFYHDIGDYLNRAEKLNIVKEFNSVLNPKMDWKKIEPNKYGDWINQRNDAFNSFISLAYDKKLKNQSFFNTHNPGLLSGREPWVYNYSKENLKNNILGMLGVYSIDLKRVSDLKGDFNVDDQITSDKNKISWTVNLKKSLKNKKEIEFDEDLITTSIYKPFVKQNIYYSKDLIERPSVFDELCIDNENVIISVSGIGANKTNGVFISKGLIDYNALDAGSKCFPLFYYEKPDKIQGSLFNESMRGKFIRRDGLSDFILERAQNQYGKSVKKEDIFYYVYGILHSPDYRKEFANDLKKMLPRIPLVDSSKDFWAFSKAGRQLADLHINYESVPPLDGVKVSGDESKSFKVSPKMKFPKKDQKDTIIYNSKITISNIPEKAYKYVVNGKSAIEWIMERYQVKTDKKSGITNDPNDWADEVGNPRYILDLFLSIINVSVQTVDIVEGLPKLKFD